MCQVLTVMENQLWLYRTVQLHGRTIVAGGGGYGLGAYISHGNGISTRYAHMSQCLVNVGDTVKQGQVIGYIGNTGDSYGAHLHFEVRINDVAVDALKYLPSPQ